MKWKILTVIVLVIAVITLLAALSMIPEQEETPSTTACTDTDGGRIYDLKGTVQAGSSTATDYCSGSTLYEYSCSDDHFTSSSHLCPYGCSNGACLPEE